MTVKQLIEGTINTGFVETVGSFTHSVGQTTDRYNVRQTALYTGLQCEELEEKIQAMIEGIDAHRDALILMRLLHLRDVLHDVSQGMKQGEFDKAVELADRAAMLDADVDLAWVTIGSAFSQGADVSGACGEVSRANLSKLVECGCCSDGGYAADSCDQCSGSGLVAIKDANGKVKKPDGWTPPNIEPFVCAGQGV